MFYIHTVKETEVNLFNTKEYEKKRKKRTLLEPLHPHSYSGLSPCCHLLLQGMEREHKLDCVGPIKELSKNFAIICSE